MIFSPYPTFFGCFSARSGRSLYRRVREAPIAGESEAPEPKMTDGPLRHALSRASIHQATLQDAELQASGRSIKLEDGHQAIEFLRPTADVASPNVARATDWGRSNARYWLRNTEAEKQGVAFADEELLWVAAFRAAEFQISRLFELS